MDELPMAEGALNHKWCWHPCLEDDGLRAYERMKPSRAFGNLFVPKRDSRIHQKESPVLRKMMRKERADSSEDIYRTHRSLRGQSSNQHSKVSALSTNFK